MSSWISILALKKDVELFFDIMLDNIRNWSDLRSVFIDNKDIQSLLSLSRNDEVHSHKMCYDEQDIVERERCWCRR